VIIIVSSLSIAYMFITLLISIGFPLSLVIYFRRKQIISIKAVMVGALIYFVFQGVLRIPALTFIQMQSWYIDFAMQNMVLTGLAIAFTAGLFETVGRYAGLRFLLRKELERKNGIAYGIGHGGIEAVLLVGVTYIVNITYSILINKGAVSSSIIPQLVSTPPSLFLMAGLERFFAILFHIAAALLVTYGIMENKKIYILYCLLFHTLLDGVLVLLQISGIPLWGIELWVAFVGLISLVFIIKSKDMFRYSNFNS
jgi:uncharacterized membrane protein YhfC